MILSILTIEDADSIRRTFRCFVQDSPSITENTLLYKNSDVLSIHACSTQNEPSVDRDFSLLSLSENKRLQQFKTIQRANQYYAGRVLAKRCWIDLESNDMAELEYSDLSVESDSKGSPVVISTSSGNICRSHLSITHKDGYVIVAALKAKSIGIDLEFLPKKNSRPMRWMTSPPNQAALDFIRTILIHNDSCTAEMELQNVLWSILEAGFKAIVDANVRSPLDLTLSVTKGALLVSPRGMDDSISKTVDIIMARPYVLSLAG